MHHPWRELRALNDWTLFFAALPEGVLGFTCWRTRSVTLCRGMSQAQRRSTIAHELEHIRTGPAHPDQVLQAKDELAADKASARRLVDLRALGEAMAWSEDVDEIADELWVDRETVLTRLAHLHPAERAYLQRRLDDE